MASKVGRLPIYFLSFSPLFLLLQPPLSFDEILQSASLPSAGPEYYEARRRLWLTPRVTPLPPPSQPSTSRHRLEDLFNQPGAVHSQEVWSNGLEKVWKGISSGGRLKYNLPMAIIVCRSFNSHSISLFTSSSDQNHTRCLAA